MPIVLANWCPRYRVAPSYYRHLADVLHVRYNGESCAGCHSLGLKGGAAPVRPVYSLISIVFAINTYRGYGHHIIEKESRT